MKTLLSIRPNPAFHPASASASAPGGAPVQWIKRRAGTWRGRGEGGHLGVDRWKGRRAAWGVNPGPVRKAGQNRGRVSGGTVSRGQRPRRSFQLQPSSALALQAASPLSRPLPFTSPADNPRTRCLPIRSLARSLALLSSPDSVQTGKQSATQSQFLFCLFLESC